MYTAIMSKNLLKIVNECSPGDAFLQMNDVPEVWLNIVPILP